METFLKKTWVQVTVYTIVWALFMSLCGIMVVAVAHSLSAVDNYC